MLCIIVFVYVAACMWGWILRNKIWIEPTIVFNACWCLGASVFGYWISSTGLTIIAEAFPGCFLMSQVITSYGPMYSWFTRVPLAVWRTYLFFMVKRCPTLCCVSQFLLRTFVDRVLYDRLPTAQVHHPTYNWAHWRS